MHHTLTLAALEQCKHVRCQARMANNARKARETLAASLRPPDLVSQLVPTSTSYRVDNLLLSSSATATSATCCQSRSSASAARSRPRTASSTGDTARSSAGSTS